VAPFGSHGFQTEWHADTPHYGRMQGIYLMLGDALASTGESGDGRFVTSERIDRVDQDHYVCRGVLLERGRRVASWAVHLERAVDQERLLTFWRRLARVEAATDASAAGSGQA
jgi:hypothetical protein